MNASTNENAKVPENKETEFAFTIPQDIVSELFEVANKKQKSVFNEKAKRKLVQLCAEQLYESRGEFYIKQVKKKIVGGLKGIIPNASDAHLNIIADSVNEYRRNHYTKPGKKYRSEWETERETKFTINRGLITLKQMANPGRKLV